MTTINFICAQCGEQTSKPTEQYNRNERLGRKHFCSPSCYHTSTRFSDEKKRALAKLLRRKSRAREYENRGRPPASREFHGKTALPEYRVWQGMKARCLDPKHVGYKNYGGRGITVCLEWQHSFERFLSDMGRRPSRKFTVERIDNDGGYEPSNCKWATRLEQATNTRAARPFFVRAA